MNELIKKVKQWGIDKDITGPQGKGTLKAQARKMREECDETYDAALEYHYQDKWSVIRKRTSDELKDGISDTCVTLILLADMVGWSLEECLQEAYNVISKRKGSLVNGQFVKESMNLQLIQQAIASTGGEYFQPVVSTPRGPVTVPWRHNARFQDLTLTFDNHRKKPHLIQFFTEGGKRFSWNKSAKVCYLERGIRRYLKSA